VLSFKPLEKVLGGCGGLHCWWLLLCTGRFREYDLSVGSCCGVGKVVSSCAGPVSTEAIDEANPFYLNPVHYNHNPGCRAWTEMVKVAAIVSIYGSMFV
jgi:hypothetical protein